jgi:hypothetical protein
MREGRSTILLSFPSRGVTAEAAEERGGRRGKPDFLGDPGETSAKPDSKSLPPRRQERQSKFDLVILTVRKIIRKLLKSKNTNRYYLASLAPWRLIPNLAAAGSVASSPDDFFKRSFAGRTNEGIFPDTSLIVAR